MTPVFDHIIITRFNLNYQFGGNKSPGLDRNWLLHRFDLFKRYTFPSFYNQTNKNFKWMVFFDKDTPLNFKKVISQLPNWDNFIPIYTKTLPVRPAVLEKVDPNVSYLITTRVDNDDAISVDFVDNIQKQFCCQDFEFINFTNGFVLCKDKLYRMKIHSNAFISLIEKYSDSSKTVMCHNHTKLAELGRINEIRIPPMWLQIIHEKNVSNRLGLDAKRVPLRFLSGNFFLDCPKKKMSDNLFSICFENFYKFGKRMTIRPIRLFERLLSTATVKEPRL